MWGLVDCDNCFCSCERVFRPELNGQPVVVLSNNDGCVVARSQEAKALGIKMGLPYYQMLEQFPNSGVVAFSSNYTLYADMSARVMAILREEAPDVIQYSIDEAFLDLHGMDIDKLKEWGEQLSAKIKRWTGMPVSIGIAPTKTLAKVASRFAKKYPAYRKCCLIQTEQQRQKALMMTPVGDVWGIGRRLTASLQNEGVGTAWEFTNKPCSWIRRRYTITGERTWRELKGEEAILLDDLSAGKQSIMTSRSFPEMLTEADDLKTHISNFAAHCAEKLRRQKGTCGMVTVFLDTNRFRNDLPQQHGSGYYFFSTPVNSTHEIVNGALKVFDAIFKSGFHYKRGGVMVSMIQSASCVQPDLFLFDPIQRKKYDDLSQLMDDINRRMGSDKLLLGRQQYKEKDASGKHIRFEDAIQKAHKSPNYSTNIDDFQVK